jgi:hypothetical protein
MNSTTDTSTVAKITRRPILAPPKTYTERLLDGVRYDPRPSHYWVNWQFHDAIIPLCGHTALAAQQALKRAMKLQRRHDQRIRRRTHKAAV